jgi:hypothetical protein
LARETGNGGGTRACIPNGKIRSATFSLQIAKASAAKLSQQKKNNSEDVQRERVNIPGFICTVASESSRQRTFDEILLIAVALRRALQH